MSQYSSISGFETLRVSTIVDKTATVYANGVQQVTVFVHAVAYDANHKYVTLSGNELKKLKDKFIIIPGLDKDLTLFPSIPWSVLSAISMAIQVSSMQAPAREQLIRVTGGTTSSFQIEKLTYSLILDNKNE